MSEITLSAADGNVAGLSAYSLEGTDAPHRIISGARLAATVTRRASRQTYTTIRLLADRPLVADAYRAYAYFRWVDNHLDQEPMRLSERLAFVARQRELVTRAYRGDWPGYLTPEEQLVTDLIRNDGASSVGLQAYINNMMNVMAFDAERRDCLVAQSELDDYTRWLATAVTEALHHFIGHNSTAPRDETRYLAVTAAHITHMLRDAMEDAAAGYYNIPRGYLESHQIQPTDFHSDAYRAWVEGQVKLARGHFQAGRYYLSRVVNPRCRLAGYAYIARFEVVLDAIERDGYYLRAGYPERKGVRAGLKMGWSALSQMLKLATDRFGPPAAGSTLQ